MNILQKFLILLLVLVSIGHSQTITGFGVKMGIVSSKFNLSPPLQTGTTLFNDRRIGPAMGIYVRYLDIGSFDFESGLYYLQKGGKNKMEIATLNQPDGTGEFLTFDIHFDNLQFQTGLRPHVKSRWIGFYAFIGGTLNYILGVSNTFRPKNDYKDFVLGYAVGFGIEFQNILRHTILIELSASDASNIYKDSNISSETGNILLRVGIGLNAINKR